MQKTPLLVSGKGNNLITPLLMSGKGNNLINLFTVDFLQLQAYTITEYSKCLLANPMES